MTIKNDVIAKNKVEISNLSKSNYQTELTLRNISVSLKILREEKVNVQRDFQIIKEQQPSFIWLKKILTPSTIAKYFERLNNANELLREASKEEIKAEKEQIDFQNQSSSNQKKLDKLEKNNMKVDQDYQLWCNNQQKKLDILIDEIKPLEKLIENSGVKIPDFTVSYNELQKDDFWFDESYRAEQSELFITSLAVRKQFLYENCKHLKNAKGIWDHQSEYLSDERGKEVIKVAWDWINFAIPIISTTFASFGRMFKNLDENSLGNLFIDEAGQALPQAAIGAILRSKRVMAVGDPSQIKPVLSLDSNVLSLIARIYQVTEKFVSVESSVQSLVDRTSQFGYRKNEDE